MVNTNSADDVDHMVCTIECDPPKEPKYYKLKPTTIEQIKTLDSFEKERIHYHSLISSWTTLEAITN